jgi:hypothetical protein
MIRSAMKTILVPGTNRPALPQSLRHAGAA